MMMRYIRDEGIVLKRATIADNDQLLTIFSKQRGRIYIKAYGVKKTTSRRISHLETGNYIKFTVHRRVDRLYLSETELIWGFSKIRDSQEKLSKAYLLFIILNRLLPENERESTIYSETLKVLTKLNNKTKGIHEIVNDFLNLLLILLGYTDKKTTQTRGFDPIDYINKLIGYKLKIVF